MSELPKFSGEDEDDDFDVDAEAKEDTHEMKSKGRNTALKGAHDSVPHVSSEIWCSVLKILLSGVQSVIFCLCVCILGTHQIQFFEGPALRRPSLQLGPNQGWAARSHPEL